MVNSLTAFHRDGLLFNYYKSLLTRILFAFFILNSTLVNNSLAAEPPKPVVKTTTTLTQEQFENIMDLVRFENNTPKFNIVYMPNDEILVQMKNNQNDDVFKDLVLLTSAPVKFQRFFKLSDGRIITLENSKVGVKLLPQAVEELNVFVLQTEKDDVLIFPTLGYAARFKAKYFSQTLRESYKLLNTTGLNDYVLIRFNDTYGKVILFDKTGRIFISKKTFADFPAFSEEYPYFSKNEFHVDDFVVIKLNHNKSTDFFEITPHFFPDDPNASGAAYFREGPARIAFKEIDIIAQDGVATKKLTEPVVTTTQIQLENFRVAPTVDIAEIPFKVQNSKGAEVSAGEILKHFLTDGISMAIEKGWESDPVFDDTAERIFAGLSGVKTSSVALLAESGAGKSHALEDIAARFATGQIPAHLKGYNLVFLNVGALGGGNNYVGSMESKINALTKWVESRKGKVIVIIDEIHSLRGQGVSEGDPNDVFSLLLPALGRGELKTIGATSAGNWDYLMAGDEMLDRRFKRVQFSPDENVDVVRGKMKHWLKQNKIEVEFSDTDLTYIIETSTRFRPFRAQPGRSIELLEQVIGMVRARQRTELLPGQTILAERSLIESASVSLYTITKEFLNTSQNSTILKNIETEFAKLQGMSGTKKFLLDQTKIYLSGLTPKDKPGMRTLLLGPSGSGKTSIAGALAKGLNRPFAHITLGAVENVEAFKSRLADILAKDPTALIFLDEIDDAKPDVINSLNDFLNNGEVDYVRRGNSGSAKPIAMKLNLKNNLVLAAANGSFNVEKSKPFLGLIPDGKKSEEPVYSTEDLRALAEQFLPKKIADRFDGFFLVPAAENFEFKEALVVASVKQIELAEQLNGTAIKYNRADLELWAEQITNQTHSRSYRQIDKIVGAYLRPLLADSLLTFNKETEILELGFNNEGNLHFTAKAKLEASMPMGQSTAVRCEDVILNMAW